MNFYLPPIRPDELYHHGILGQKWGKKNGPPYPLGSSDHSSSESKAGWRNSLDKKGSKKYNKITNKNISSNSKFNRKGLTEEQKNKIRKAVVIAGGMTVAAAGIYVAHRAYVRENVGTVLKSDKMLQVITKNANKSFDKAFYAAFKNGDKLRYQGYLGAEKKNIDKTFKIGLKVKDSVKVASNKEARQTFLNLYNSDKSFKDGVDKTIKAMDVAAIINGNAVQRNLINSSHNDSKKLYDAFNMGLVYHDANTNAIAKTFYDAMKSKGFQAIYDMNDIKYSGYKSNSPVIIFDTKNVVKDTVTDLTDMDMKDALKKTNLINSGSTAVMGIGGLSLYEATKLMESEKRGTYNNAKKIKKNKNRK